MEPYAGNHHEEYDLHTQPIIWVHQSCSICKWLVNFSSSIVALTIYFSLNDFENVKESCLHRFPGQ
jgi:hypothetical protein